MKLAGIILAGTLGLSSLAITGDSLNKKNIQEDEQKPGYMCMMMEAESMEEMRDRCMQYHERHMNREEADNHRHQEYGWRVKKLYF